MATRLARQNTLALVAALALAAPAAASAPPPRFTAQAGLSISKLRAAPDPSGALDFQSMKSFTAGVGLAWPIGGSFEVSPEVMYVEKGLSLDKEHIVNFTGIPTSELFEILQVTRAIEVPVLLRWQVPALWSFHPVLIGGPFMSFERSEMLKWTGSVSATTRTETLNDTDYGLVLGAGLGLNAGPGRAVLEGRYDLGLADLGPFGGSAQTHSRAFSILTGYRY